MFVQVITYRNENTLTPRLTMPHISRYYIRGLDIYIYIYMKIPLSPSWWCFIDLGSNVPLTKGRTYCNVLKAGVLCSACLCNFDYSKWKIRWNPVLKFSKSSPHKVTKDIKKKCQETGRGHCSKLWLGRIGGVEHRYKQVGREQVALP